MYFFSLTYQPLNSGACRKITLGTLKQGLDQIVLSLGMNDCDFAKKLITDVKQQRSNRIEYKMMNSLQVINQATPTEMRYKKLLERVGTTVR